MIKITANFRRHGERYKKLFSHNMHQEHTGVGSLDENFRNALPEENSSQFWDRQGFPSAFRSFNQNGNQNTERQTSSPMRPLERPYQFQLLLPEHFGIPKFPNSHSLV